MFGEFLGRNIKLRAKRHRPQYDVVRLVSLAYMPILRDLVEIWCVDWPIALSAEYEDQSNVMGRSLSTGQCLEIVLLD